MPRKSVRGSTMLLIIYIPVTQGARERERERKWERQETKRTKEMRMPGDETRVLQSPLVPPGLGFVPFPFSPPQPLKPAPLPSTPPDSKDSQIYCRREEGKCVDLSSYVPTWQFVCSRTLRIARDGGWYEMKGCKRDRPRDRRTNRRESHVALVREKRTKL